MIMFQMVNHLFIKQIVGKTPQRLAQPDPDADGNPQPRPPVPALNV